MNIRYDNGLLFIDIKISYLGKSKLIKNVVIDTGASHTIISPDIVSSIGISASPLDKFITMYGIGGEHYAYRKKIDSIQEFKDQEIYLSGSIYLYYGNKAWYLYGASENILRDAMPNFAMQWAMIEDSIDLGSSVYDFRGVSGDLNPENPLYGLYKFKKGFNGDFVEFVGSFDLVNSSMSYNLYKKAFPKFKEVRNSLMNKKQ